MADVKAIDTNAIEAKNNHIIYILNACGIICNSFSQLDGLLIQREVLINDEKYAHIIKTELPILKKHFSSSFDMIKNHKDEFLFSLIKQNLMKGIEEGCYRKDLDIDIISKFRLETVFIPFNLHLFPLNKFNSIEVHTQLMEHFVYGLMTVKGHELMNQYKKLSNQAI